MRAILQQYSFLFLTFLTFLELEHQYSRVFTNASLGDLVQSLETGLDGDCKQTGVSHNVFEEHCIPAQAGSGHGSPESWRETLFTCSASAHMVLPLGCDIQGGVDIVLAMTTCVLISLVPQ